MLRISHTCQPKYAHVRVFIHRWDLIVNDACSRKAWKVWIVPHRND
ncbi:hypothetical protein FACS1894184_19180 [Clostridia bacterium]|nr:hypothetical protein FACS1894184_19180 [Clostridia bacterium]